MFLDRGEPGPWGNRVDVDGGGGDPSPTPHCRDLTGPADDAAPPWRGGRDGTEWWDVAKLRCRCRGRVAPVQRRPRRRRRRRDGQAGEPGPAGRARRAPPSRRCQRAGRHDRSHARWPPARSGNNSSPDSTPRRSPGSPSASTRPTSSRRRLLVAADRLSLPVITFPEGAALADVTAAVLDALLEAQGQRLRTCARHPSALHPHRRSPGAAPAEIAATLHDAVGLSRSRSSMPTGGRSSSCPPTPTGRSTSPSPPVSRQPIHAGDHQYGEIVALTGGPPLDDDQLLALERASMAIAVRLAQASAVAEAQERFAAISLEELIAGHVGDAADVAERANSFGWDLGRPRAVLLASVDPPTDDRLADGARHDRRGRPRHAWAVTPSSGPAAPRSPR